MKKLVFILLGTFLFLNSNYITQAEVTKEGAIKKEVYATTEDVLYKILEPKIHKIITEKYGKEMSWHFEKINKVNLIVDHTKKPSDVWYDMDFAVRLTDPEKDNNEFLLDFIEIRVDLPNLNPENRYQDNDKGLQVKLKKYQKFEKE